MQRKSMSCSPMILSLSLTCFSITAWGADVTQFRGSNGDGIVHEENVPSTFSETEKLMWKIDLPGKGWSSPVVADGKIWLTTAVEVVPDEDEREKLLLASGDQPKQFSQKQIAKNLELKVIQIDSESGQVEKVKDLFTIDRPDSIHKTNSYASPTPFIDGDFLYCHFGTYGTVCLNRHDLSTVWQRTIPVVHSVGPGSSPFICKDLIVLICDGINRQFVIALDKKSGETAWEVDRPKMDASDGEQKKSYNTPVFVTDSQGREQLICMSSQWIVSYVPETGEEIWRVRHGKGFSVVPRPVVQNDIIFISTGFMKAELWAIKIDGSGDVTDSHVVWKESRNIPTKPSPIVVNENIFVVNDTGIATCFDSETGETIWRERIGGNFSASPVLVDQKLFLASQEGVVTILDSKNDFNVIAENQLSGQIMASPIVFEDSLVIRTDSSLYRFRENEKSPASGRVSRVDRP
ncbi:PQQ-binding-like beta-propeller repeat protein [Thalassoglobus neptunius]|nr:PQQ-binding-like beta-propeller repeat protein [Thalassoglobus neptunius]